MFKLSLFTHWLVAQKQSARPISEGRRSVTVRANHFASTEVLAEPEVLGAEGFERHSICADDVGVERVSRCDQPGVIFTQSS